ncbi:MAG: SpoIIE family protein phosphatase [Magnetococcales bacterium]|nr:SpoIIE family protein phosphatase [Magnetococcales bacterium]
MSQKKREIILVVDDTPENIDVLKGALVADYTVRPAPNGEIALKAAAVQPRPDLILLDIMMPGMDGFEVCRRLKTNPATRHIPVIFVTAKTEVADELEGLNLGAVDYITKPFRIPIVQARVRTHLALEASKKILDKQNRTLVRERELIETILVKMRGAEMFDGRNLRHLISPVEVTAGDMLLSVFTPDGRQMVLLGDFTGHGLPAAIGGPLVTYILNEFARRGASGAEILQEINSQLCARLPVGVFFAAFFLEISTKRKKATLWNAALPDGILLRDGAVRKRFASKSIPLGIFDSVDIVEAGQSISLKKGDRLYAFSDGIIEAKGGAGEMFGMGRLEHFLVQAVKQGRELDDLLPLLNTHVGSTTHEDDLTLVEVQFRA